MSLSFGTQVALVVYYYFLVRLLVNLEAVVRNSVSASALPHVLEAVSWDGNLRVSLCCCVFIRGYLKLPQLWKRNGTEVSDSCIGQTLGHSPEASSLEKTVRVMVRWQWQKMKSTPSRVCAQQAVVWNKQLLSTCRFWGQWQQQAMIGKLFVLCSQSILLPSSLHSFAKKVSGMPSVACLKTRSLLKRCLLMLIKHSPEYECMP